MTAIDIKIKKLFFPFGKLVLIILLIIFFSQDVGHFVREGITLCFSVIVGSVFPFMIITDLAKPLFQNNGKSLFKSAFEKILKVNKAAFNAYAFSLLCGFPLGAKMCDELYAEGIITKDEFERFIGFSSTSSPAFVISGIGAAMRESVKDGIALYIISILSSITVGALFANGHTFSNKKIENKKEKFDLITSVRQSTAQTINVCGFVILFSVITGLILSSKLPIYLKFIITPFLEISNAAKLLSSSNEINLSLSFVLTAFAVSFTGFSAHLQVKSFISDKSISMKRYYIMKLMIGLLSMIIAFLYTCFL